jgi:hypothetical protein
MADVGPTGEDAGKGGKYLLLPPGSKEPVPTGYIPIRFETYNAYSFLRAIPATSSPEDVAKALDLVKKVRIYKLSEASNPPEQRYIGPAAPAGKESNWIYTGAGKPWLTLFRFTVPRKRCLKNRGSCRTSRTYPSTASGP